MKKINMVRRDMVPCERKPAVVEAQELDLPDFDCEECLEEDCSGCGDFEIDLDDSEDSE